ncbi:MAG: hypothetical protein LAQ30_19435 [Acidobacteriia bacterium]|nr:hypothetical protein [Terriglobia bacterium]
MRGFLCLLAAALFCAASEPKTTTLRGKLIIAAGEPASLETADHQRVTLDGDESTRKILGDQRLNGYEVEAKGHFTAPRRFLIDPIHTRAMMVRQDGRLKMITYWCNVCSIRAYTPGPCVCCQRETTLDLRDPDAQ